MTNSINGILVTMSAGMYVPMIEIIDHVTGQTVLCDYRSSLAQDTGLSNPTHWAHAVYRTMDRFCRDHQEELQSNNAT